MKPSEAEKLIETIRSFVVGPWNGDQKREVVATGPSGDRLVKPSTNGTAVAAAYAPISSNLNTPDEEAVYQRFKARIINDAKDDPILVKLLASANEIVVEYEPRVVTLDAKSLKGRLALLIARKFFDVPKKQGTTRAELARTGSDVNSGNLSTTFSEFVRDGFLTREGDQYQRAPGVRVTERDLSATP